MVWLLFLFQPEQVTGLPHCSPTTLNPFAQAAVPSAWNSFSSPGLSSALASLLQFFSLSSSITLGDLLCLSPCPHPAHSQVLCIFSWNALDFSLVAIPAVVTKLCVTCPRGMMREDPSYHLCLPSTWHSSWPQKAFPKCVHK